MAAPPFSVDVILTVGSGFATQAASQVPVQLISTETVFTVLFLTLGPFKIIGPFAQMTHGAPGPLVTRIAVRAILFAGFTLLLTGYLGEGLLSRYNIPLSVLALAAGIILFLVALLPILQEFRPVPQSDGRVRTPTLSMAITPLAYPTIVTPYGIAALIILTALARDQQAKLLIGVIVLVIMLVDLVAMLLARRILQLIGVVLQIVGSVLAIIQVALALQIILSSIQEALRLAGL